jgi:hypothetical protein
MNHQKEENSWLLLEQVDGGMQKQKQELELAYKAKLPPIVKKFNPTVYLYLYLYQMAKQNCQIIWIHPNAWKTFGLIDCIAQEHWELFVACKSYLHLLVLPFLRIFASASCILDPLYKILMRGNGFVN